MTYKLTNTNSILRVEDGAYIPQDPTNSDYARYLQWRDGYTEEVRYLETGEVASTIIHDLHEPALTDAIPLSLVGNAHYSEWEAVRAFFGLHDNPNAWECAELVKAVYAWCGLALEGKATPSDVMLAAQKMGGGVVLLEP